MEAVVAVERFVPGALTFLKLPTYHARPAVRCFSARGSSPRTHWARKLCERFRFFANVCFTGLLEANRATVASSRLCCVLFGGSTQPRTVQAETFPSGTASIPGFFPRGLTPENRVADATSLRCFITARARNLLVGGTRIHSRDWHRPATHLGSGFIARSVFFVRFRELCRAGSD